MRVVLARQFGAPDMLDVAERSDPVPAAGQVLIEVVAVPVLHLDVQIRAGWEQNLFGVQPPYVPGSGYVGRVCGFGAGVDSGWSDAMVAVDTGQTDGYVEYALAAEDALVEVPVGVGLVDAAALLHDGRTALGLLERVPVESGDQVLVVGAAGGLGSLLVQLVAARGGQVTAAARGEAKLAQARSLGAGSVVDYTDDDWGAQARAAAEGCGFDVVFDGIGGELGTKTYDLVASGGRFSAHGAPSGSFAEIDRQDAAARDITVTGIEAAQFEPGDVHRLTRAAYEAAADVTIRAVVGQSFALHQARAAHEAIEARQVSGKTVLLTAAATSDGGSR